MQFTVLGFVALAAFCSLAALIALWGLLRVGADQRASVRSFMRDAQTDIAFLFDGEELISHTAAADPLITQWGTSETGLSAFLADFGRRFPNIRDALREADDAGYASAKAGEDSDASTLEIEQWDGFTRFRVRQTVSQLSHSLDEHMQAAQTTELRTLRAIAEDAPGLIWRTGPEGRVDWANEAYLALARRVTGQEVETWPPVQIFSQIGRGPYPAEGTTKRTTVALREGTGEHHTWYDVFSIPRDNDVMHFASNADQIVSAESSRRDFVQTLTKTFAHLSIGMAIFDKNRQLALFNPALLELVSLPIDFLSQRPALHTFLDQLRESQLIPEPKNYKSWRQQMSDLESRAEDGSYCETWALPGGLTYRVTGRPHPDGAIGFLFEDISAEVSLTRRFRTEIDTNRAVIDTVQEGVAVFTEAGILTLTNQTYQTIWGADPESSFIEQTLDDLAAVWEDACEPTDAWDRLREWSDNSQTRQSWTTEIRLRSGEELLCRFSPIRGRATMISFASLNRETESPPETLAV